jgi:AraC-like DNA-binding protein
MRGTAHIQESGQSVTLEAGEMLCGNSRRWRSSVYGVGGECEGLSLIVSPKLLPKYPLLLGKARAGEIGRCAKSVLVEFQGNAEGRQELLDALAREFLVRSLRLVEQRARPERVSQQRLLSRRHFVQAVDYMQSCAKNAFSLELLSSHIGMAAAEFSRLFRQSTGETPLRAYNRLLIGQVEEALLVSQSVKEVVYQFGFQTPSHFTALYRKVKGQLPSETRVSKS